MNSQEKIKELKEKAEEALQRKSVFSNSNKDVNELISLIDDLSISQFELELKVSALEERKKVLEHTEIQLHEKLASKDKLLAILAHDLKTPFHTLLGYSYLLLKDYSKYNTAKRVSIIQTLYENIKQTHDLLENILVWSQSQTGKIQYNPRNINITTILRENIGLFKATAMAKGVTIEYNSEINDLMIWADPEIIQTVVRNLLTNAIKFTPKNGKVSAGIKDVSNGQVVICICDNGIGIPFEIQDKLLSSNEGYTSAGTNNERGTGLGLILCKEFIEKSGGKLWFNSEPGEGSNFYFSLRNKPDSEFN